MSETTPSSDEPSRLLFGVPLRSLRHLLTQNLLPPVWEVEPLVIQGQRVMLVGQWGAFKSWLLQHLGLSLASGPGVWLNIFKIPAGRRVLYVDKEMSEPGATRRLQRLAAGMKLEQVRDYPFDLVSHPMFTMTHEGGARLLDALNEIKTVPSVIIMETYRRVLQGKENDQADVSAFWERVEPIFKAGITLYVSHHMRKPKRKVEDNRTMASGSTDILAGPDTVLAVSKGTQGSTGTTLWLEHLKGRDTGEYREGKAFPVTIRFEGDETGPVVLGADGVSNGFAEQMAASPRSKVERAKMAMLTLAGSQDSVTSAQLLEVCKDYGGQRTREKWLQQLVTAEQLVRIGRGSFKRAPGAPHDPHM